MLLSLWQKLQLLENTLADRNLYRMYSTIVSDGLNIATIPPSDSLNANQPMLDIDQVRILSISHKYNPSRVHAGLLIYSVDGQTDFVLNDTMLRIKTGDILIHQTHHVLAGQEDLYRDLIRTLFGTHRVNLIGLVFTFSGDGQVSDCMKWEPTSASHTTPMHPTERKLLEIVIVSLYMNNAWLSMGIASHVDVETLSQTAKKEYLMKLAGIEQQFNKRQQEREQMNTSLVGNFMKLYPHHSADSFRSFEWTPNRQETFDSAVQGILDEFHNLIQQTFADGEFDRDQYAYYDDNPTPSIPNLVSPYAQMQIQSGQCAYSALPRIYR